MSGEGTGGGGAVAAFLVLWVVAVGFVLMDREQATEPGVVVGPDPSDDPVSFGLDCQAVENCDAPVTRAEVAAAFVEAFDLPQARDDVFVDDDGTQFEDEINQFAAAGITTGCGDGAYCPDDTVMRDELARFIVRALELPRTDTDYFDDDGHSPHEEAINALGAAGITRGCAERAYCPSDPVTRANLIAFLEQSPRSSSAPMDLS